MASLIPKELSDKWGLRYSHSLNVFRADPLVNIIYNNVKSLSGIPNDFVILGIYDDMPALEKEADSFIKKSKAKIIYRDIYGSVIVKEK